MKILNLYEKIFIILFLLIAIYITATCPCKIILICHKYLFYILLIIPLLYVFIKQTLYKK